MPQQQAQSDNNPRRDAMEILSHAAPERLAALWASFADKPAHVRVVVQDQNGYIFKSHSHDAPQPPQAACVLLPPAGACPIKRLETPLFWRRV